MTKTNAAREDWDLLRSFFPARWKALARTTGALKGLRQDKSEECCLRLLLMHLGCGFSLRETVVRARRARLANLSDVALLKRLRKSKDWLHQLCCDLFQERGLQKAAANPVPLRLLDATVIKEPGPTGSQWRVHYSLRWPDLVCDYFKVSATDGAGSAETLQQFPILRGDWVVVDRGYCHASGIHFVASQKACVTVRLNPQGILLHTPKGALFPLLEQLKPLQRPGQVAEWKVAVPWEGQTPVSARLCVVRKSNAAIALAVRKLRRAASKEQRVLQPETLICAEYVMVLTTCPAEKFSARLIREWYRCRWQIELVFKRFKQIAELGHLPQEDPVSSQAWLYGKLLVALLTEKLIQEAGAFSPWGYTLRAGSDTAQPVA
jgi:hypothetical protein